MGQKVSLLSNFLQFWQKTFEKKIIFKKLEQSRPRQTLLMQEPYIFFIYKKHPLIMKIKQDTPAD